MPFVIPDSVNGIKKAYQYDDVSVYTPPEMPVDASSVALGAPVSFEHETDNPFDSAAVAVCVYGQKIGYMNKGCLRDMLFDFTASGLPVLGFVSSAADRDFKIALAFYRGESSSPASIHPAEDDSPAFPDPGDVPDPPRLPSPEAKKSKAPAIVAALVVLIVAAFLGVFFHSLFSAPDSPKPAAAATVDPNYSAFVEALKKRIVSDKVTVNERTDANGKYALLITVSSDADLDTVMLLCENDLVMLSFDFEYSEKVGEVTFKIMDRYSYQTRFVSAPIQYNPADPVPELSFTAI